MLGREWFRNTKKECFQGSIGIAFKYTEVDFDDDEMNLTSGFESTLMTAQILWLRLKIKKSKKAPLL